MATTATALRASPDSRLGALTLDGDFYFLGFTHPFPYDEDGNVRPGYKRFEAELPAGMTVMEVLESSGFLKVMPRYDGVLVRKNGRTVKPEAYETTVLGPGDRMLAQGWPHEPVSIIAALSTIGAAISSAAGAVGSFAAGFAAGLVGGVTGAGIGTAGFGFGAIGAGVAAGSALGTLALYAGASFLLSLATRALIGSPSGGGDGSAGNKRISPTASGAGNIISDGPIWIPCGDVRVTAPHLAIPFQPGVIGGHDQDPALRMMIGVGGDCLVSDLMIGDTDAKLRDIEHTPFQAQTTLLFPTVAVKRPGITLKDKFGGTDWEVLTTENECDELGLVWNFQAGLKRIDQAGENEPWQVTFEFEYRAVGAGSWTGFFTRDASGNAGRWKVSFVVVQQSGGLQKLHLMGKTSEPFFLYLQRRVARDRYEVRFRLRPLASFILPEAQFNNVQKGKKKKNDKTGQSLDKAKWPRDRWPVPGAVKGNTDTSALFTDPLLVEFQAFRDEPAVENCPVPLSGYTIQLNDQTTKGDESGRLSFRCRRQIPELSGGARTAPTTTSNPVAIALDLITGIFAGDTAVPDSQIDLPSWQAAFDYANELVDKPGGGTEVRHKCDVVIDRDGVGRREQVQDLLSNFRMRMAQHAGKYHMIVDRERTAPANLFGDTDILEFETERTHPVVPDMLRVTFQNGEKDGEQDELRVFNDSPPVPGKLPNGGYAARTASAASISTTISRDGHYANIARLSGTWSDFPEEGWVCIRYPGLFADARLFLIDGISSDLLTLTVVDKGVQLTAGAQTGSFDTTVYQRFEALSLPYSQRPSEAWREAYYRLAQRNRPEVYKAHLGREWQTVERGQMIEVSSGVPVYGKGSGLALQVQGPLTAATAVRVDEEFDLSGISVPVIKFPTWNGSAVVVTRIDIDPTETASLRSSSGDDGWLVFDGGAVNLDALGFEVGGEGNGTTIAFGEKFFETHELVVQDIVMGENLSGTLVCIDHAPEIFNAIADQYPVPRFNSGITETLIGDRARPAMPEIAATEAGVSTPISSISAGAPSGGLQVFTRASGSFDAEGYTPTHKVSTEGFATDPDNNVVREALTDLADTTFTVSNAAGSSEAGTGDERVRGVLGTSVQALDLTRAASGVTKLDVDTSPGGGVVNLDGPAGQALFSGFSATGFVELLDMPDDANSGFWEVTALRPGSDGLVLADPAGKMVTSTGNGNERAHQALIGRSSGSFLTDGIEVGHRVLFGGFDGANVDRAVFTVRGVTATRVAVDDPFGLLETETGSGDETVTVAQVPLAFELESTVESNNELRMFVTVPLRPGSKPVVSTDTLESRYRLRDRRLGRITTGWVSLPDVAASALEITFGPIPVDSDFDVAARIVSKGATPSEWMVLTGNGERDLPPAPLDFQVHPDSVATAEGQSFALRCEWVAPTADVWTYLLRYSREGDGLWRSRVFNDETSVVLTDIRIGTYYLELYVIESSGRPSRSLFELFDFEPDRDFELVSVNNFRLVNHA